MKVRYNYSLCPGALDLRYPLLTEMEQDISRLIGKLAEVPNIQKTTAVLVDEHQIKKQTGTSGSSFRWIYLDQLLGKTEYYLR